MADGTMQEREVITPVGHREPTAGHPPAYVVFLGAVSFLGGRSVEAHQVASALLGACAIPLFALVGRRLVGDRTGLIAAGLAATYVMIWINDGLVMSETAVMVVVPIIMLAGLRFIARLDVRSAVLFGAAGALGTDTPSSRCSCPSWRWSLPGAPSGDGASASTRQVASLALGVVTPWIVRNPPRSKSLSTSRTAPHGARANQLRRCLLRPRHRLPEPGSAPDAYGPNGELLDESQRDVVARAGDDLHIDHSGRLATAVVPARVGHVRWCS
jgi:hypothetical protein